MSSVLRAHLLSFWKTYWDQNQNKYSGQIFFEESLHKYTYYRIGGPAAILLIPKSLDDLDWIKKGIQESQSPFFLLGQGSNLLVSDSGFEGVVIRLSQLNTEAFVTQEGTVCLGGGLTNASLLRKALGEGWNGFQFLIGVPGSIGGAVRMNAGTTLGETKERLLRVKTFSFLNDTEPTFLTYEKPSLQFAYRKNLFLPEGELVWNAEFKWQKGDPSELKKEMKLMLDKRKSTQPVEYPSCGSVFKNPKSHLTQAWRVIDELGLRGFRLGDAQFSPKHPNFIINLGQAQASDVADLINKAKKEAREKLQIELEEEVIYLGF